jgi:hypothetical protein
MAYHYVMLGVTVSEQSHVPGGVIGKFSHSHWETHGDWDFALGRVIPNRFIRASKVVAFRPSRWAAPLGPLTRQPVSSKASMMRCRVSS